MLRSAEPRQAAPEDLVGRVHAMATDVTVRIPVLRNGEASALAVGHADGSTDAALREALAVFGEVQRACTRFEPTSPLMRANAQPDAWHTVPTLCLESISEAWWAYRLTDGAFDPRVLGDLVRLGYDRSLPFAGGPVSTSLRSGEGRGRPGPWRPQFRWASHEVNLGGHPIDLGGIGKGLAVRWATTRLQETVRSFLVEAGGDCYCAGRAADGERWRVGVEDPRGGNQPLAVLALQDRAVTTSSIRLRQWRAGGRDVHHLIDPRSGEPGGHGLLAVTVVDSDPAVAEVLSKVLFLAGAQGVAGLARDRQLAALWVDEGGTVGVSPRMHEHVLWRA